MLKIKNYVRVQSLEEAYDLCQKKNNVVLSGMLWQIGRASCRERV